MAVLATYVIHSFREAFSGTDDVSSQYKIGLMEILEGFLAG